MLITPALCALLVNISSHDSCAERNQNCGKKRTLFQSSCSVLHILRGSLCRQGHSDEETTDVQVMSKQIIHWF